LSLTLDLTGRALLALLLAGHMLGDFVLQTDRMASNKVGAPLVRHAAVVTVCHIGFLAPFMSFGVLAAVTGLGVIHLLIDFVKTRFGGDGLASFTADQAAHFLSIGLALWLLMRFAPTAPSFLQLTTLYQAGILVAAYSFNIHGGAAIVSGVLRRFHVDETKEEAVPGHGRVIGILERLIALTLGLLDQWAGLGLIIAAKSLARFRDLEERRFSEYYLIGTLTSLLVAITSAIVVMALLR
jgi:Protein of unknown function (DUF3307)